jgi:23S rRNA (cytosine1962-C5)-methyltransferase
MNNPIEGRLRKLYKHKSKWARKNNFEAYRLYERDIPDFPYIIDVYQDHYVIYVRENEKIDKEKGHLPLLTEALKTITEAKDDKIHIQQRFVQDSSNKYQKNEAKGIELLIHEGDLKFKTVLNKYIDTGIFLDHRPLRHHIYKSFKGKSILNLFCYTGSLSVAAAKADNIVTSVDMSKTYLNWAKENFELNGIPTVTHNFINQDVFNFLKNDLKNKAFDVIVLDPPTFSQSKKMNGTLDIQRDHPFLIKMCMDHLAPQGILYFSNNLRSFKLDDEVQSKWKIKDKTHWSIPEDFRDEKIHKLYEIKHP